MPILRPDAERWPDLKSSRRPGAAAARRRHHRSPISPSPNRAGPTSRRRGGLRVCSVVDLLLGRAEYHPERARRSNSGTRRRAPRVPGEPSTSRSRAGRQQPLLRADCLGMDCPERRSTYLQRGADQWTSERRGQPPRACPGDPCRSVTPSSSGTQITCHGVSPIQCGWRSSAYSAQASHHRTRGSSSTIIRASPSAQPTATSHCWLEPTHGHLVSPSPAVFSRRGIALDGFGRPSPRSASGEIAYRGTRHRIRDNMLEVQESAPYRLQRRLAVDGGEPAHAWPPQAEHRLRGLRPSAPGASAAFAVTSIGHGWKRAKRFGRRLWSILPIL